MHNIIEKLDMKKDRYIGEKELKMFNLIRKEEGILGSIKKIPPYIHKNIVRQILPTKRYVRFNDVSVNIKVKMGDDILPKRWIPRKLLRFGPAFEDSTYESALAKSLRSNIKEGDRVVVIGAGWGVTTVIAARQVGQEGFVEVFEGARKMVDKARNTVHINGVEKRVRIHHSIVAKEISLYDDPQGASITQSGELPRCDVLELDCEGAEKYILQNLKFKPRIVIVETHGVYGSPTNEIINLLSKTGYDINNIEVADEGWRKSCLDKDIMVVSASFQE